MADWLLLGSTGLLGQALVREAKLQNLSICGVARSHADVCLDIRDDLAMADLIRAKQPKYVINACAIVDHNVCESDHLAAYEINSRPAAVIARLSSELGFKSIFISTDGYYAGDQNKKHLPDDEITLLNEYARTKYAGECFTLTNPSSLVVRTNIVGFRNKPQQPTFVEWVISSLVSKQPMTLFNDYFTSSITVNQFSAAFYKIMSQNPTGVINLASSEVSSKETFIRALAASLALDISHAVSGSVRDLKGSKRADSLGLDVSQAETLLGEKLPDLQSVIDELRREYHALEF